MLKSKKNIMILALACLMITAIGVFVNAWMTIPKKYNREEDDALEYTE